MFLLIKEENSEKTAFHPLISTLHQVFMDRDLADLILSKLKRTPQYNDEL
jgi:hypothetical protein